MGFGIDKELVLNFKKENDLESVKKEILYKIRKEEGKYDECLRFKYNPACFEMTDSQNVVRADFSEDWVRYELEHGVSPDLIVDFLQSRHKTAVNIFSEAQKQFDEAKKELTICENMHKMIQNKEQENSKVVNSKGTAAKVVIDKVSESKISGR